MSSEELLKFCSEKGLLLDKNILTLLSETSDIETIKILIEKVKDCTQKKFITKTLFDNNKDKLNKIFLEFPEKNQKQLEKLRIKLGLSIEISKIESNSKEIGKNLSFLDGGNVKVVSISTVLGKKLEVNDFVKYFRGRFSEMSKILQEKGDLKNLISINKISGENKNFSLIGIVSDIRKTKNNNLLLEIEDLTGKINVLINKDKKELYEKAEDISLDTVLGFVGAGNKEIFFVNDIFFPDSFLPERKHSPIEEFALFTGDLHVGSRLFMENNFLKFVDYLNGKVANTPEVEKIRYLFLVGDIVSGVGIYPNQERELNLPDVEEQYSRAAELLGKIRKDLKIVLIPGNHDALRIMEPQPLLDEKYAWPLYNLKNVIVTGNPSQINIGANRNFSGFDILAYHGYSFHYYANNIPKLVRNQAVHRPDQIMHYLLKNKHLAPTHSSTLYFPSDRDPLLIRKVPDIFFAGHTHKSAVSYYNNILTISSSTWESLTAFQEKMGNKPDFCKVPMFNLKTRAIKILDFEDRGEENVTNR